MEKGIISRKMGYKGIFCWLILCSNFVGSAQALNKLTYYTHKIKWNEGSVACKQNGGSLFNQNSQEKYDLLEAFEKVEPWKSSVDLKKDFWVGLYESEDESFTWTDCDIVDENGYSLWHSSTPKGNCVYLSGVQNNGAWKLEDCSEKHYFLCENINGPCTNTNLEDCYTIAVNTTDPKIKIDDSLPTAICDSLTTESHFTAEQSTSVTSEITAAFEETTTYSYTSLMTTVVSTTEVISTEITETQRSTNGYETTEMTSTDTQATQRSTHVYETTEMTSTDTQETQRSTHEYETTEIASTVTQETQRSTLESETMEMTSTDTQETQRSTSENTEMTSTTISLSHTREVTSEKDITSQKLLTSDSSTSELILESTFTTITASESASTISIATLQTYQSVDTTSESNEILHTSSEQNLATTVLNTSLSYDVTHTATTVPFSGCICHCITVENFTLQDLDVKIEKMKRELTVDVEKLSSTIRQKISIKDDRISSRNVGLIGVGLLSICFGFMLFIDCLSILEKCSRRKADDKKS